MARITAAELRDSAKGEIAPGSNPDPKVETVKEAGNDITIICDNRVPFLSKFLENTFPSGTYDRDNKTFSFMGKKNPELDGALQAVKNTPYFEVDPRLARYAIEDLKQLDGVQFMMRDRYTGGSPSTRDRSRNRFIVMVPDEETYTQASTLVHNATRVTAEQISNITSAIKDGDLTSTQVMESLGLTTKQLEAALKDHTISVVDANRLQQYFSAPSQNSLKDTMELVRDGRLTDANAGCSLDPNDLAEMTQKEIYDLNNRGRDYANSQQRNQVQTILDMGFSSSGFFRKDDLSTLGWREARAFIAEKTKRMNDDQTEAFSTSKNMEGASASFGTKRDERTGYFENPATNTQRISNSQTYLGTMLPGTAKEVELPKHGVAALKVIGATNEHLLGYTNEEQTEYTILDREKNHFKDTVQEEIGASTMQLIREGERPLADRIVTVSLGKNGSFVDVSQQDTLAAAKIERLGLENAFSIAGAGVKPVAPSSIPHGASGTTVASDANFVSFVNNKQLYTVPAEDCTPAEPTFMQKVTYNNGQAQDQTEDLVATTGEVKAATTPRRKRS